MPAIGDAPARPLAGEGETISGHPRDPEAHLETTADRCALEPLYCRQRRDRLSHIVHNKAGDAIPSSNNGPFSAIADPADEPNKRVVEQRLDRRFVVIDSCFVELGR